MLRKHEDVSLGYEAYSHWCPACNTNHTITTKNPTPGGVIWTFDGNQEAPTFSPSIRLRTGHFVQGYEKELCWCTFEQRIGRKSNFKCVECHYFIKNGMIEYCGDCSHAMAGQIVPMIEGTPYAHPQENQGREAGDGDKEPEGYGEA